MRKKNHRYYTYYIIVALLAWLPTKSHAQFGINDMPSIEAMISNHKTVRTALDIRMIAELGVEQAHEGSQKSIEGYQESSKRLDKYKRCFDIIDLILNGTATAFHGVRTYQSCSSNINSYLQLLNEYEEKILLKGKVWSSDTIIYTTSKQTIEDIKSSASSIYKSYIDLSAYLTGTAECKTESMMLCLQCINENMDAIDASVRNAYLTLWSYMTIRLGRKRYSEPRPSGRWRWRHMTHGRNPSILPTTTFKTLPPRNIRHWEEAASLEAGQEKTFSSNG